MKRFGFATTKSTMKFVYISYLSATIPMQCERCPCCQLFDYPSFLTSHAGERTAAHAEEELVDKTWAWIKLGQRCESGYQPLIYPCTRNLRDTKVSNH